MARRDILKAIKEREMDRGSFLKMSGLLILGAVGAKGVLEMVSVPKAPQKTAKKLKNGFGNGKFGA